MKKILISDMTLAGQNSFSFKEKIGIARQLSNLNVDVIELSSISNKRTDTLFVRTVSSFVKNSVLSVEAGMTDESLQNAVLALNGTAKPRICVKVPVSPVGMEYTCHKKAPKMLDYITHMIVQAKKSIAEVEFCALDATRAEKEFLISVISAAIDSGATHVTICDDAAEMMPDDFGKFISEISDCVPQIKNTVLSVMCNNKNGMAQASSIIAVKSGAACVKTAVNGKITSLEIFSLMIKNCGNTCGFSSSLKFTELHRIIKQIIWITETVSSGKSILFAVEDRAGEEKIQLDSKDGIDTVLSCAKLIGYDLSEEDGVKVYDEFCRVAEKKAVGAKELDAIIASTALQVPPTYVLESYVINTGNIISASAQIKLQKDGKGLDGICIGDGPIDASFLTIEKIVGHHYELDDFQIQSVTEGKEAMGSAIVKLRNNGKLYSGKGISTDIIGASIRAYLSALNKIVYEEA